MENNNGNNNDDPNFGYFSNLDEVGRLRFTISRFKEYDQKRKRYLLRLEEQGARYRARIAELERLTERQHDEIECLIASYDSARPLIANPTQKAYVFKLLETIQDLQATISESKLEDEQLKELKDLRKQKEEMQSAIEENTRLKERITALERAYNVLTGGRRKVI